MPPSIDGNELPPTGGETVTYVVSVIAEVGELLQSIIIRGRDDGPVEEFEPTLEPCAGRYYEGMATGIPRRRFPLEIEVVYCDGQRFPAEDNPPLNAERIIVPPVEDLDCGRETSVPPSAECVNANASVHRRRTQLSRLCREVADCRRAYREYIAISVAASIAFLTVLAAGIAAANYGGWIGAIIAIVMFAIAGALALLVYWALERALRKRGELDELEPRLTQARTNFQVALEHVYFYCCPHDYPEDRVREMPC